MTELTKAYGTLAEHETEKEGSVFVFDENDDTSLTMTVRRSTYGPFKRAVRKALHYGSQRKKGRLKGDYVATSLDFEENKQPEFVARYLITGWTNCVNDGEQLEFSVDLCTKLFRSYPDMFDDVWNFSTNVDNYRNGAVDTALGK